MSSMIKLYAVSLGLLLVSLISTVHADHSFDALHRASEAIYRGDGSWGKGHPYRMALRDVYWRADVYAALRNAAPTYEERSRQAYDYLMRAHQEGDTGVFGFPADINNPEFGSTVNKVIKHCPQCIHNGWVVSLPGEDIAELYYDHGYALASLAQGYLWTREPSYLAAVVRGADWALDKPLHHNLNYLSALSKGLSNAFLATGDVRYLNRAIYLHEQGIFPYLNPQTGQARDRHNQKLEYHAFIVSGILALKRALTDEHDVSSQIDRYLTLTLEHMQQRNISEKAPFGATWPGISLLVWYELAQTRPLTILESEAKERSIAIVNEFDKQIQNEQGFRLQKALYSYIFIGLHR